MVNFALHCGEIHISPRFGAKLLFRYIDEVRLEETRIAGGEVNEANFAMGGSKKDVVIIHISYAGVK